MPEPEETLSGEVRERAMGLPCRGEDPRRAEAGGIVGEQQKKGDRRAGREERQRPWRTASRHPESKQNSKRRRRVFRDRRPAGQKSRGRGEERRASGGKALLPPAHQVPREKEEGRRPRVSEEGASVKEDGR